MSKAAAAFNAVMGAQAASNGGGGVVLDLTSRVTRLEAIMSALKSNPAIADAMATAEAEAQAEVDRQRVVAEQAAQVAAEKARQDKVAALKAQLAAMEADGSIPSPAAVAASFNPSAPADGVGGV